VNSAGDYLGRTPLMLAAGFNGNPEVTDALIQAGAEVGAEDGTLYRWRPLFYAAAWGENTETMTLLLRAGAEVNKPTSLFGRTVLMAALAKQADPTVIEFLIAQHANAAAATITGWTPLMEAAASHPDPEVIDLLIRSGAQVNVREWQHGMTALMIAAEQTDNPDVVHRLLFHGADPGLRDASRRTAADYAAGNAAVAGTGVHSKLRQDSF